MTVAFKDAEELPPHDRHHKYNTSAKGHARKAPFNEAAYLSRPFVGWDGEGVTLPSGEHIYVMLACSDGDYIANPAGLSTRACLNFMLRGFAKHKVERAIHVIYGGGYDVNMMLRDLTKDEVRLVHTQAFARWGNYTMGWRPGKSFFIGGEYAKGTLYDVASFFQCPFIKACDDYLGDDFRDRDLIVENKALRSSFRLEQADDIKRYNDAELDNLVRLCSELRLRLHRVGLRPSRWDGPGAVAAALMRREHVKVSMAPTPPRVARAARFAYSGGRFEIVRFGSVRGPAYEYDVNSAYPRALLDVPNLARGTWHFVKGDAGPHDFALYHVSRYNYKEWNRPAPLFWRDAKGMICYPSTIAGGWYWSPEIAVCKDMRAQDDSLTFTIDGTWWFEPEDPDDKPFAYIEPLYLKRQALKAGGDGAHVGIKLALNSHYGKLAQQIGWSVGPDGLRIPPFHQIEWAGYVTAWCRAQVMRAAMQNPDAVIAFETDALFTSEPLHLPIGKGLGEWEATEFAQLTYVQSGIYFGETVNGETVAKSRGVDKGSLTHEMVLEGLAQPFDNAREVTATLTRFVGAGLALAQSWKRWRRWETNPKVISLTPASKRTHFGTPRWCPYCPVKEGPLTLDKWHVTHCELYGVIHSHEFPIEWVNPNPEMSALDELRAEHMERGGEEWE